MKIARFFSVIFACIGIVLLIGSMAFFLWNRNAEVRVLELPVEAVAVSQEFAKALDDGDLEAAARLMYGQPDLGVQGVPEKAETALLWDAFCSSIEFTLTEDWAVEQGNLLRTGRISNLDISLIVGKIPERARSLMDRRIAAAQSLTDIYDEQNNFREDLVDQVLEEAIQQAIAQDGETVTREVTIKLVNRDGRWWVVPHQNLLQILTGLA